MKFGFSSQSEDADITQQPLLDDDQILRLLQQGRALASTSAATSLNSHEQRAGEQHSPFRGSGFDYDESRIYQPGDDLRYINWRLVARSGELYSKVFREERESSCLFVIDRRAAMRFGTKQQLKVGRAVELAIILAGQYLHHGFSVGGLLIQPDSHWLTPQHGQHHILAACHDFASPCPPLDTSSSAPELNIMLSQLAARANAGCQIILLSDFHDLGESENALLTRLSRQHPVKAVQILDPVEWQLPVSGNWLLSGYPHQDIVRLTNDDKALKQQYRELIRQQQEKLKQLFASCQIPFISVRTNDAPEASIRQVLHG